MLVPYQQTDQFGVFSNEVTVGALATMIIIIINERK
jgi:hypothetical protein